MPLKPIDLKTVESYKKAIKLDVTRITQAGNTKFWVYRDIELPTASGSKLKIPALISLVEDTAVKAIVKGKQPVCKGVCALREGKVEFEPAQGKLPYELLKKSVPLLLGKMMHIPNGADDHDDEEDEAPKKQVPVAPPTPPSGSPQTSPKYAQLNASWKQLSQQAAQRMTAFPAMQDKLKQAMAGIPEMLQGGKLGDAAKRIEQLQSALKTPPTPPPGPTGVPDPNRYAKLNAAWKQLSQQATQRMSANPAERDALTQAMAGIPEMLQGGKLGDAQKRLEQLQTTLKVAPPVDVQKPKGQAEAWKKMEGQLRQAIADHPGRKDELVRAGAGIAEMIRVGKAELAEKLMANATALLDRIGKEAEKQKEQAKKEQQEEKAETKAEPKTETEQPPKGQTETWKKLEAQLKQALADHPGRKDELVRAGAGIGEMIRVGKTDLAEKLMANATALLARIEKEAEADKVNDSEQSKFENRYQRVEDTIAAAAKGQSETANKIRLAQGVMFDKVEAGDFDAATKMLERILALIPGAEKEKEEEEEEPAKTSGKTSPKTEESDESTESEDTETTDETETTDKTEDETEDETEESPESTEEQPKVSAQAPKDGAPYARLEQYRSALSDYGEAKMAVRGQLDALRRAAAAQTPNDKSFLKDLDTLAKLNEELAAAVGEAAKAAHKNAASPASSTIKRKVRKYQAELASHKLAEKMDSNRLGVKVTIKQTLGAALAKIQQEMPA